MKATVLSVAFCLIAARATADWKPADIHPKVFHLVECWLSDTAHPVATEINLDAVRADRNQFDYDRVRLDDGWITCREDQEMLRFRLIASTPADCTVLYQENGGGTLTTQSEIRFSLTPRSVEVDGQARTVTVLRVLSISTKP